MALQKLIMAAALTVAFAVVPSRAEETPTVDIIMEKNYAANRPRDSHFTVTMTLTLKSGEKRERRMDAYSRIDDAGNQARIGWYTLPQSVKGMGTLTIEHTDNGDDIWVYLPAHNRTNRIPSTNRGDNFMGSDFTYEDIITPRAHDYDHSLVRTETCGEVQCYVVRSTPATDRVRAITPYGAYLRWIRSDNFMTARSEMTDGSGAPYKEMTAEDFRDVGDGKWLAAAIRMKDLKRGTASEMLLSEITVNTGIPKELFSQRRLER